MVLPQSYLHHNLLSLSNLQHSDVGNASFALQLPPSSGPRDLLRVAPHLVAGAAVRHCVQETQVKCMLPSHRLPLACCGMNVLWLLLALLPHVKGIPSAIGLTKTRLATER